MTRRLLISYLSLTVFVLLLLEVPLAVFFHQRETERLTADIERDAAVLATIYVDALEVGSPVDSRPALDYATRTGARVVIVDSDGISVLDSGDSVPREFSTRPEVERALSGSRASGTRDSETLGTELLYVAVPAASGGMVHGAVRLTFDTHEVQERVRAFWWGLAAVGGVVLLAVAGIGWGLSRSITSPILRLQASAARFSQGDLTPSDELENAPAELVDLEESLNTMAGRIDRMLDQQRAFVADASHQLRTPLTALQLRLENLRSDLDDPARRDDPGLRADVDATLNETERLSTLVADLLHLARAERIAEPQRCDLAVLARDRVDTWREVAALSDVDLVLAVEEVDGQSRPFTATCVVGGVEQILDNLLSNAIEASPNGSVVEVGVARGTDHHRLWVRDQGPGLSEQDRTRALERFWRANPSTPGTGLGLAIVRSLAERSGGAVELSAAEPTGLVAEVTLPAVT